MSYGYLNTSEKAITHNFTYIYICIDTCMYNKIAENVRKEVPTLHFFFIFLRL